MTESIADLKTELHAHEQNREKGVAHISRFSKSSVRDNRVEVEFELPHGDATLTECYPDTDAFWDALYEYSAAKPPCIDELVGTTIPVEWDPEQATWDLAITLPDEPTDDSTESESNFETPTEWAQSMSTAMCCLTAGAMVVGGFVGTEYSHGHTVAAELGLVVLLVAWLVLLGHASRRLRPLYNADYEWVVD